MNSAPARIHPDVVDRMLELYCDWRTECGQVQAAYERFASAERSDRALAFAAYTAALDREGTACDAYEAHIGLITSCFWANASPKPQRQITRRR